MCDYSLLNVRARPAKVGDKLTTRDFGTGTRGFAAAEDYAVAVCVLPGTELAFSSAVTVTEPRFVVGWKAETLRYATAIFRQVNNNGQWTHHDALEFPDGRIVPLTQLKMPFIRTLFEPWPFWLANRGCSVPRKRTSAGCHVCFTPESGHVQCKVRCLLRARSGHCLSGTRR